MGRQRLVLFSEGEGDVAALHDLAKRILAELNPWAFLHLDPDVIRVGGLTNITGSRAKNWTDKLLVAQKRGNLGGVLLLMDGDANACEGKAFCSATVASLLAKRSMEVGGAKLFSVACVFARQEYESWLIAGVESLAGKLLPPNGRPGVRKGVTPPPSVEESPRDAKRWLSEKMEAGYRPTRDQQPLTNLVDLDSIRKSAPRSFKRLENALRQLAGAIQSGAHVATPG